MMNYPITINPVQYDANELLQSAEAWVSNGNITMDGMIQDLSATAPIQNRIDALAFAGQSPSISLCVIQ